MEGIKDFFIEVQCMQAYQRVLADAENGVDSSEYDLLLASIYQESMNSDKLISDDPQEITDIFDLNQNGYIDNEDYNEILANGPIDIDNNGEISEEEVNVFAQVLETLYNFLPKMFGGRTINDNENDYNDEDNYDYEDNYGNNDYSNSYVDSVNENSDLGFYGYQDEISGNDNLYQSEYSVSEIAIQNPIDIESPKSASVNPDFTNAEGNNPVDNLLLYAPDQKTMETNETDKTTLLNLEKFDNLDNENDMQNSKKILKEDNFAIKEKIGKNMNELNIETINDGIDNWYEIDTNSTILEETINKAIYEFNNIDKKDKFFNKYDGEFYEEDEYENYEYTDTTDIEKDFYKPKSSEESYLEALKEQLIRIASECDDIEELEQLKEKLNIIQTNLDEIKTKNDNSDEIYENDETIDENVNDNVEGTDTVAKEENVSKLSETNVDSEDENTVEDEKTKEFKSHISSLLGLSKNEKIENIKMKPDGTTEILIDNGRILYSVIYTKFEGGEKLVINMGKKFQKELIFYDNGNTYKRTKRVLSDGKTKINSISKYADGTIIKMEIIREAGQQFYMVGKDILCKDDGNGKTSTTCSLVDKNGKKTGTFLHELIRPKK